MKNTIHKRTHGGGTCIHRILLSRNDLHAREGVKHDLGKYFLVVKGYRKNITLPVFQKTAFYIVKDGILLYKRPYFTLQKVIYWNVKERELKIKEYKSAEVQECRHMFCSF